MFNFKQALIVLGVVGVSIGGGGCANEPEGETGGVGEGADQATAATQVCRVVQSYDYVKAGKTYRFDVTTEDDGDQFVDERQIGGPLSTRIQYRIISGQWSVCPHPNENLTLKAIGQSPIAGIHVCLPDGREEFHGSDFQRLLVPQGVTANCSN